VSKRSKKRKQVSRESGNMHLTPPSIKTEQERFREYRRREPERYAVAEALGELKQSVRFTTEAGEKKMQIVGNQLPAELGDELAKTGRKIGTVTSKGDHEGDDVFEISKEELMKKAPSLVVADEVMQMIRKPSPDSDEGAFIASGEKIIEAARRDVPEVVADFERERGKKFPAQTVAKELLQEGSTGPMVEHGITTEDLIKKVPKTPEEGGGGTVARKLMKSGTLGGPADDREVAVLGYLSTLANTVKNGIALRATCNRPGRPYPECLEQGDIIEAAVKEYQKYFEKSHSGSLTTREQNDLRRTIGTWIGSIFLTRLKNARIFQFKGRDFDNLHHLADVHVTTAAGYKWTPADAPPVPDGEAERVAEFTVDEGINVPFPEKLPFKSCYLAWGAGVQPSPVMRSHYGLPDHAFHLLIATLITDDGWCWNILLRGNKDTAGAGYRRDGTIVGGMEQVVVLERTGDTNTKPDPHHTHVGDKPHSDRVANMIGEMEEEHPAWNLNPGWLLPYSLMPWVVASVIEAINNNDSLIHANAALLKERGLYKALSKRTQQQFLPRPYYTVIIQPTVYEEIEKRIVSQPRQWSHQWDVRAHYCHKVLRGTLPIDPKLLHQLTKRGYQMFHALNRPTADVLAFMQRKRIIPPRRPSHDHPGEWLAYLKFHREAFIKGPKSKPYIPSIHKLKGGVPVVMNE